MPVYAYRGDERFIAAVQGRLESAGFTREGEVEAADIVLTYCTNMTALEDLYLGDDGIMELMQPGSVAVDLSASTPSFAKEMAAVATVNGMSVVSAAMVVADKMSADAFSRENLACIAAGYEDALGDAQELLDALFGSVTVVPDAATAQLLRAVRTIRSSAEMVAAAESFSLLKGCSDVEFTAGLLEDAFGDIALGESSDERFIVDAMSGSSFEGGYNVEMLMGEISAAITSADECQLIMPQTEAAFHLLELLAVVGGIDLSPAALALVYEGEGSEMASKLGLDWSRVDEVYGSAGDGCGCGCGDDCECDDGCGCGDDCECDDGCDCGHDHHESSIYDDFDIDESFFEEDEDDEGYLPFR